MKNFINVALLPYFMGEEKKQEEIDGIYEKQKTALEKVASLSKEEARKLIMDKFEKELVEEKSKKIRDVEEEIKRRSDDIAKDILVLLALDVLLLSLSYILFPYLWRD